MKEQISLEEVVKTFSMLTKYGWEKCPDTFKREAENILNYLITPSKLAQKSLSELGIEYKN